VQGTIKTLLQYMYISSRNTNLCVRESEPLRLLNTCVMLGQYGTDLCNTVECMASTHATLGSAAGGLQRRAAAPPRLPTISAVLAHNIAWFMATSK
jgi:hypothetical protein